MSFATNTLPEEFQQEHGSIDLGAGTDQAVEDSTHQDEDLDLDRAGNRVWLCKVPRFLMDKWNSQAEQGAILGRVRVYDEKDEKGNPKIAVLLNDPQSAESSESKGKRPASNDGVPTEYRLTMQNTASKNMYVFGERIEDDEETGTEGARKKRRVTSMLGTVHHECSLTPSLSSKDAADSYARILRERQRKAAEPKRTLKMLDVDQATANRLASGMGLNGVKARVSTFKHTGASSAASTNQPRFSRMPHNELLDLLINQFSQAPYWSLKSLNEHVKQPQTYLKQTLGEIANLVRAGPYVGMYALKPEFKRGDEGGGGNQQPMAGPSGVKKEEDAGGPSGEGGFRVKKEEGFDEQGGGQDDEDDDDEDGMEFVS
ncbi:transcription factor IIF subunit TFG2 [Sporobolomyces salmoneus]|uniref:transcription factor IIF subunit TFG2 n=1 Tax=Sporobolomyces salmoneus TaxID=183962 RepID=UPI0031787F0C